VKEGDIINIDIPNYKLEVKLSDQEIAGRLAKLPAFESRIKSGYLKRYIEKVTSASTGAVFKE
jgi:dihydroxy-acid dehydratase